MINSQRLTAKCHACRVSVLDAFAALGGLSISRHHLTPVPFKSNPLPHQQMSSSRRFLSASSSTSETQPVEPSPTHTTPPKPTQTSTLPGTSKSRHPTRSHRSPSPQTSPDLPPCPPTHQPSSPYAHLPVPNCRTRLSLSVLDLRDLQPPPALGANLIMILGTARSTKHLNVSADRFCRWCRSTYKLRPYADGLLGRNELKLKLRRRARRQKLAASVGNTTVDADDGITTGWICVNVGPVDEAVVPVVEEGKELSEATRQTRVPGVQTDDEVAEEQDEEDEEEEYRNPADDGYVGFGSRSAAPRIVVQMFTEEKRAELDLEGLWDVRRIRRAKKEGHEQQLLPLLLQQDRELGQSVELGESEDGDSMEGQGHTQG